MRGLTRVLLVLLVVVTSTSAWVRLSQSGLSCVGAPDCYASRATRAAAEQATATTVARTLHRIAASAAGAAIVALLFFGWRAGSGAERAAIVALGLLAVGLATLGRYTPSGLPAVTLGNLLGGMAMIGLAAALGTRLLRVSPVRGGVPGILPWVWLALAMVALQVAVGGMISVHYAAFACATFPLCDGRLWPPGAGLGAFDPLRELAAPVDAAARTDASRQAVVLAHRLLGVPTLLLIAWLGARAVRAKLSGPGRALLALAAVQVVLGLGQFALGQPLVLAVAHNVAAACVVIALATLIARPSA